MRKTGSPDLTLRRELVRAYGAAAVGVGIGVTCGLVGAVLGWLITSHPLGLVAGGFIGLLAGASIGVLATAGLVGLSRARSGLVLLTAGGLAGVVHVRFGHHSWVFVVLLLALPWFSVTIGRLLRHPLTSRHVVLAVAGTVALLAVLLLDVWVAESATVRHREQHVAASGVDVWATPMGPGCEIRIERLGETVEYVRTGCSDPVHVSVTLRRAPEAALGPEPQVAVSSRPRRNGWSPPPASSAVASMRRGDTVIEVASTTVRGDPATRVLAVARGMQRQDAGWLATRETPLHGWVHDVLH